MRRIFTVVSVILMALELAAQQKTLRVDYIFSGTDKSVEISLDEMSSFDGWAGRRVNTDSVLLKGNGQIMMSDAATGKVLYRQSFSTLFQEWQATEEAVRVRKAFENVFLLPMPDSESYVRVELYDFFGNISASLTHKVDPSDIMIRRHNPVSVPSRYLMQNGTPQECIDIAIVAEGYSAAESEKFYHDASVAMNAILEHEPFGSYSQRFNFLAVALTSADSGVSVPGNGQWKNTALGSHFNTFYMDRYLTTLRIRQMHDKLCGLPYEHIIILANTDTYGGGGIYNSYTLTTAGHPMFEPVVVHEFGHSFAGLADEYYYDDMYVEYYYPESEPWEQNITTMADFGTKWKDMLPDGCAIPTEPSGDDVWKKVEDGAEMSDFIGVYEGAGYQSKGVYRGYEDCRMHTNKAPSFCPVCQRAIARLIEFYTEEVE